ncbi:MAG: hypothetical protein ACLT98_08655 [Eggerthellaceae bacterium]
MDMPLALLISDLDSQRLTECGLVSLVIFTSNVLLKAGIACERAVRRISLPASWRACSVLSPVMGADDIVISIAKALFSTNGDYMLSNREVCRARLAAESDRLGNR